MQKDDCTNKIGVEDELKVKWNLKKNNYPGVFSA